MAYRERQTLDGDAFHHPNPLNQGKKETSVSPTNHIEMIIQIHHLKGKNNCFQKAKKIK